MQYPDTCPAGMRSRASVTLSEIISNLWGLVQELDGHDDEEERLVRDVNQRIEKFDAIVDEGADDDADDGFHESVEESYPRFFTFEDASRATGRREEKYPQEITDTLTTWFLDHMGNPYPTKAEKEELMTATGLTRHQVRRRTQCFKTLRVVLVGTLILVRTLRCRTG
mmetsp:Transcript_23214/g.72466  ORF Transcript_23214/g.72466 Transcript_23214/m.72466 type:complete len:168 (-) Transcript_23214:529-1032(-)